MIAKTVFEKWPMWPRDSEGFPVVNVSEYITAWRDYPHTLEDLGRNTTRITYRDGSQLIVEHWERDGCMPVLRVA